MTDKQLFNRRRFLKTSVAGAMGTGMLSRFDHHRIEQESRNAESKIEEYRTLGRTGFKVSDIGYGAGLLTNANVFEVALDRGINYIDTAEHYSGGGSESAVGEALKKRDRKSLFLTTKLNLLDELSILIKTLKNI